MKMNRAVLTAVVIVLLAGAGWYMFRRGSAERIDLLERYDQAEKKGGAFNVADATLAGETKRAISAPANGRLIFRVRVPEDGWLRVSLGVKPDGSTFRRPGRCTVALARRDGRWLATHTHFSLFPQPA